MAAVKAGNGEELVNLWQHYWRALGCCVKTIVPVAVCFIVMCYASATLTGWEDDNEFAKAAVIIVLAYFAVLVFYLLVMLPLIIFTRAVDDALFTHGGSILTSSIVEISILAMLVVGSLLITSHSAHAH